MSKLSRFKFFDSQISSSNVNDINLKIFWAIVGYTSLREKSTQILERNKPLACLWNMTECMLEIRLERLLWKLYTIRAYSTPILCSTIECCPLLQKLCIALFLWKTLWRGIEWGEEGWNFGGPFFINRCPFWPI